MKEDNMNFNDTEIAYRHLSKFELYRALALFKAIQLEPVTLFGTQMMRGFIRLGVPINWAIKPTIFHHFVAGENIEDCRERIDKQFEFAVQTILDYSVEGQKTEANFDHALALFKRAVDYIAKWKDRIPFAVFKPSALGDVSLVKIAQAKGRLTDSETEKLEIFRSRVTELCEYSASKSLPILVDAEESWVQQYFDELVFELQKRLNKNEAIVYNTLQMYRTDKLEQLKNELALAQKEGFRYGVKLVRGAYMEKEREWARDLGLQSPIHPNKKATDTCFDDAVKFCLENIEFGSVVIGSHNEVSNRMAADHMKKLKIANNDHRVYFSQLLGMADHISYNLAHGGFNVAKYLPYGPVKDVLPYLFRRAEENSSVQSQAPLECKLIQREIERRKKSEA